MATLADDAVMESNRIDLALSGEPFFARGNRVVTAGWLDYYPYSRQKDLELPLLQKDDLVELVDKQLEAKETQPPSRYGQGTLIELMEKHNLGTKATRHAIIQNLYDRGYVHGNPVEPTEMGIKMAEALQEFAPRIASPEMTAELEKDMDLISVRDLTKEEVVTISRDLLRQAYSSLEQNREQMAAKIYEGITDDRILGDCPKCGTQQAAGHPVEGHQEALRGLRGLPGLRPDLSAAAAGRHHRHRRDLSAVRQSQDQDPGWAAAVDTVPRPLLPHQGRVPGEAGGAGGQGRSRRPRQGAKAAAAAKTAARRRPAAKTATATKATAARRPAAQEDHRGQDRARPSAAATPAAKTPRPEPRRRAATRPAAPGLRPARRRRARRARDRAVRSTRPRTPRWTTPSWRAWAAA